MKDDHDASQVRESADVSWHVLESWVFDANNMPIVPHDTAEEINNRAEFARQQRQAVTDRRSAKRGDDGYSDDDVAYRHKVEELAELKRRYRDETGERCEPFTQHSTDEIDELEGLVDAWFG